MIKDEILALAARNRIAKTQEGKAEISLKMEELKDKDPKAFTEALESLIRTTADKVEELTIAEKMGEMTKMLSMAYVARNYFGKSRSWLAHKINGDVINGKPVSFTEEEKQTFKYALADMSARLKSLGISL